MQAAHFLRPVPAVDRAARLLDVFEAEGRPLGISDLARRLGASKGSVRDILETLRWHGLLQRDDATKLYQLGPRLVRLGQAALARLDLPVVARPFLADLADATGETVLLLVPQGERALILDKAEGNATMRVSAPVGRRIPVLAGAVGKVTLAHTDPAERTRRLAALPRYTARTVVDATALAHQLEQVLRDGYALDDEEYLDGVRAAAAPVRDASGRLVAVLLTVGLAGSLSADHLPDTGATTARAAATLSAALGGGA
jgi:DNA-binding IclR family transcriptional regulator